MDIVKKKVFDLNQIVKDEDYKDEIQRPNDDSLNDLKFDKENMQKAIDAYMDKGNPLDGSFYAWVYDISSRDSSYSNSKNQIPFAEIITLSIDEDENAVYAELQGVDSRFYEFGDDDGVYTLSMETKNDYKNGVVIIKTINGVILYQNSAGKPIVKGSQVLMITRAHNMPGSSAGKGARFKFVQDVKIDENGSKSYLVEDRWFNSEGLLVQGRGIRIKKPNGENLS